MILFRFTEKRKPKQNDVPSAAEIDEIRKFWRRTVPVRLWGVLDAVLRKVVE